MKPVAKPRARANQAAFEKALAELQRDPVQRQMVEARERAGLTQAQLADRMGTTQSAIARMEGGWSLPSLTTLRRLAEVTGSRLVVRLDAATS